MAITHEIDQAQLADIEKFERLLEQYLRGRSRRTAFGSSG